MKAGRPGREVGPGRKVEAEVEVEVGQVGPGRKVGSDVEVGSDIKVGQIGPGRKVD